MRVNKMLAVLLSLTAVMLTGCWSHKEINDIGIVTATGVDLSNDKNLLLSLQIAIPSSMGSTVGNGGNKLSSTYIVSEKGATVSEAYRNIQAKVSRRLFFSHSRVLIIGEKLAKKGVKHIIDFQSRYHENRMNSFIILTPGKALDLLTNLPKLESSSAEKIRELSKIGGGLRVSTQEFWDMILTEGIQPIAPCYVLKEMKGKDHNIKENEGQTINGTALFKNDKLLGWLDNKQTQGILWIRNEMANGVVTVKIPKEKGGGKISSSIIRAKSKVVPMVKNGKLKISINIKAQMNVMENYSKENLDEVSVIEDLQKRIEAEIKKRVQLTVNKVQKDYKSDIFGFGLAVYKKYPKTWNLIYQKKWENDFPQLVVEVNPSVSVKRVGLIK